MPVAKAASPWFSLAVALAMNLLNLFEPLTVDDVCHSYYAAQVAKDPLHPFEFEIDWHQKPVVAWDVMVAPVNSYYWAPAIAWFGDSPIAWKAWFLPLQWLFCHGLLLVLRRLLSVGAGPVLVALALGPAVLPGLNLMLEVPMLAFAFTSLAVLLQAFERRSAGLAVAAGVLLGLAFQTKYSAMGFFAPWCLFAFVHGRWRELAIGLVTAAAVALGIEWLVSCSHGGGSYFMRQLVLTQRRDWSHLVRGMVLHVGWLGMPTALLAAWALGLPGWLRRALLLAYVAAHVVVAMVPDQDERAVQDLRLDSLANLAMAAVTWGLAGWTLLRLAVVAWGRRRAGRRGAVVALPGVLVVWFVAEIASSMVVSPFPAARRCLLVLVVFTFAVAWLALRRAGGRRALRWFAGTVAGLGVLYQGIDWLDSRAVAVGAQRAADYVRATDPAARVLFTGGWGFEYYAVQQGMQPLLRGRTAVQAGDFLVVGSIDGAELPWFDWHAPLWLQRVDQHPHEIGVADEVPFSLQLSYYSGRRSIGAQHGSRFVIWVYRVLAPFHARELTPLVNPWRDH